MPALLYVLVATLLGAVLVRWLWSRVWAPALDRPLFGERPAVGALPAWMVFWPAAWVVGTLALGWASFLWAQAAGSILLGSLGSLAVGATVVVLIAVWSIRQRGLRATLGLLPRRPLGVDLAYTLAALLLAAFIAFRTLWVDDGALRVGVTVVSDFGPHLAIIRSFSEGVNFPPQYPHFPDGTMRYHFMFQFHVATLEALGLRLDWAFNLPSMLGLTACLMLLYALAAAMFGSRAVAALAGVLFMFRSSFAVFTHALAQWNKPDFWQAFWNPKVHIGATPNEAWGLFAQNVYANQRHLAFALAVLWLVLIAVLPLLQARRSALPTLRGFWLGRDNWVPENGARAVFLGVLLGAIGYWNGAVVLAALMVLAGVGLVAKHRLEFAIVAALALGLSVWQWSVFAGSASATTGIRWFVGFLAQDKSVGGIARYYVELLGVFIPLFVWAALTAGRVGRALALAFILPLIFASTVVLTVDVNANHKFVMLAVGLANLFVAAVLVAWFRRRAVWSRGLAAVSVVLLTATGVVDLRTLQIMNRSAVAWRFDDPVMEWIRRETPAGAVFLTHWASLNAALLAGRPIYYGWPYYAWSAGHATAARDARFKKLYAAADRDTLVSLARAEGIDYIVVEWENRPGRDYPVNEAMIAASFQLAFQHPERATRIYRVTP